MEVQCPIYIKIRVATRGLRFATKDLFTTNVKLSSKTVLLGMCNLVQNQVATKDPMFFSVSPILSNPKKMLLLMYNKNRRPIENER